MAEGQQRNQSRHLECLFVPVYLVSAAMFHVVITFRRYVIVCCDSTRLMDTGLALEKTDIHGQCYSQSLSYLDSRYCHSHPNGFNLSQVTSGLF
ncbi:hypothetical protein OS493_040271 [Desmophyllum pertusum]|uniref:Uncharacterized protein n=1 Tax=Desmophyllum pertusum TaxID=174260 RepID=A0A9X0CDL7_9CNID|nr:hypothetical protein OS493_040271 [Desmophyllum pertusum]